MKALTLSNLLTVAMATLLTTSTAFANPKEDRLYNYHTEAEKAALATPPSPEELFAKEEALQRQEDYNILYKECRAVGAKIANKSLAIEAKSTAKTARGYAKVSEALGLALDANMKHAKKYAANLDKPNPTLRAGFRHGNREWDMAQLNLNYTHEAMKHQGADWLKALHAEENYTKEVVISVFSREQLLHYGFYEEPLMLVKNFSKLKQEHKLMFCKEYAEQAFKN